jgi:signal transduction histidine kinase
VGNKVAGFEVGAVDYVTKPIDQQEVMARITTHLTIRNLQQDLQVEVVERRKTEEMLRQYTEMLRTQNEELDAFAHTVAHNLKNPLGLLTSLAEFLHTEHHRMKGEELSECLRLMSQDGYKAITIIEDLLLFASVRKDEVEAEPLDMIEIVTLSNHRLASMIECNKAEIIFPDSWPTALGYAPWIEEVWVNYVSNAIKYGGRPPQIKLGATMQNNSMIRFWVKDNGLGLSTSEQRQLFTPFTRLSSLKVEGHGLGLSIVRRIVEKLGGQVHIESDGIPGQGSVFSFTLPAAPLKTTVLSCQTNHVLTAV